MTDSPKPNNRGLRIAVQILGILASLAALGWCLNTALKPSNREQFAKLAEAPAQLIAALLALSFLSLGLNGMAFWLSLLPIRRLRIPDILATNAVCTFLGYLPFKAGAIVRFAIHNRRDKIPVATIGAWFASLAGVMAVTFTVMIGTAVHYGRIDGIWLILTIAIGAVAGLLLVAVSRYFRGEVGIQRMERLVGLTRIHALKKPLRWNLWLQLHAGFDMLSSPTAVLGGMANRLLDTGVQGARFVVAAKILKLTGFPIAELTLQQALMVSLLYYIVGIVSPSGLAGLREGAVGGFAGKLLALAGMQTGDSDATFVALGLLVSATEFFAYSLGGGLGLAWLRPDRLLKLRERQSPAPAPPPTAGERT